MNSDYSSNFLPNAHQDINALFFQDCADAETDTPTTFHNSKTRLPSGRMPGNRRVTNSLKSGLLDQLKKIQLANSDGSPSIAELVRTERERFNGESFLGKQQSPSELYAIDRAIEDLTIPSFNPPASLQGRVRVISAISAGIQVAGFISDGLLESFEYGCSAVCSTTPQNQRGCDHVVEHISSLAITAVEFAGEQWDGSRAQRVYNTTSNTINKHWQEYVESSNRALELDGLSVSQIEQYNEDFEIIGRGAGTFALTSVGGAVAAKAVTSVRKSMQYIKTNFRVPRQITPSKELTDVYSHAFDPSTIQRGIKPSEGLATRLKQFETQCADYLISGEGIGPNLGKIEQTLLYHTSNDGEHALFYLKNRHSSKTLTKRGINPVYNSFKLTPAEQMDFMIEKSYALAQGSRNIKRVSYAVDSDYYDIANIFAKKGLAIEGKGSFSLGKGKKPIEVLEVKLKKPDSNP